MAHHDPKLAQKAADLWPDNLDYFRPQTPEPKPERELSALEQMYAYYEA